MYITLNVVINFSFLRASNVNGVDEHVVEVIVLGPPKAPEKPIEVIEALNGNAVLKVKKPSDDGGSPITGYTVEKFCEEDGKWTRATFVPGNKTGSGDDFEVTIPNLKNGQPYKFRVKAENDEGESGFTTTEAS
jgi:hypothetical protein